VYRILSIELGSAVVSVLILHIPRGELDDFRSVVFALCCKFSVILHLKIIWMLRIAEHSRKIRRGAIGEA
jgi:hypothetical protein